PGCAAAWDTRRMANANIANDRVTSRAITSKDPALVHSRVGLLIDASPKTRKTSDQSALLRSTYQNDRAHTGSQVVAFSQRIVFPSSEMTHSSHDALFRGSSSFIGHRVTCFPPQ